MVRLVHHNAVFGALTFEYRQPLVRVGSDAENDLVIPHSSVLPHHCVLALREDSVALSPAPGAAALSPFDPGRSGATYGLGERFRIGEIEFVVELSSNTIAIPEGMGTHAPEPVWSGGQSLAVPPAESPDPLPEGPRYHCPDCQLFFSGTVVTRIGLVGRHEHQLCPHCSRPVQEWEPAPSRGGWLAPVKRAGRSLLAYLLRPPRRGRRR